MENLFKLNQPGFPRFISASLVVHIVILALALFVVKPEPKRLFYKPVYTQVELMAAPKAKPKPKPIVRPKPKPKPKPVEKTKPKPIKKAKPKPAVKAKPKPVKKDAIALKKEVVPPPVVKEVSIDDAIKRLEEKAKAEDKKAEEVARAEEAKKQAELEDQQLMAKLEEIQKKTEYEERRKEREVEELKRELEELARSSKNVKIDAPMPSFGSSENVNTELFELEFKAYYGKVGARIQSLWINPRQTVKGLVTIVSIKIDRSGMLLDYWIEKRSGDKDFDDTTLRAVAKAAPLPALPGSFTDETLEMGLRFCSEGC